MKFSRLLGVAIAGGSLFSSGVVKAQINYRLPSNGAYPSVPPALVTQHSTYSATNYSTNHPSTYPTTNSQHYSIASVPASATQFSGPSNAPLTRLPPSDSSAIVGHTAAIGTSSKTNVTGLNSVLTSPAPGIAPLTAPNIGPITGPMTGGSTSSNYGPLGPRTYTGVGYGVGAGIGQDKSPIQADMLGSKEPGCSTSSSAFQPFSGSDCGTGCYVGPNCWYGGVYGLVLTRDMQEHYTFSYDTANEAIQYTDAKNADIGWGGGFAVVAGRYFNCGANAIEAVYWGWFPEEATEFTFGANAIGDLSGIFNWDSLTYNGLNMGGAFVDDAEVHALFRKSEVHNVELNVLSFSSGMGAASGSPFHYTVLAGWRYFRFRDHLTFRSDPNDVNFTGEVDEIFYDISTTNNLIGFQVGGVGTYVVGPRLSLNGGTKVGFFGNHISHRSQIGGAAGTAVINNGPNAGREFLVDNSKNDVAFLTELFFGVGYNISNRWSASAGYRSVAVTGLAMPTDQIYPDLRGINDLDSIESQSSLILHGAYFGAQFSF